MTCLRLLECPQATLSQPQSRRLKARSHVRRWLGPGLGTWQSRGRMGAAGRGGATGSSGEGEPGHRGRGSWGSETCQICPDGAGALGPGLEPQRLPAPPAPTSSPASRARPAGRPAGRPQGGGGGAGTSSWPQGALPGPREEVPPHTVPLHSWVTAQASRATCPCVWVVTQRPGSRAGPWRVRGSTGGGEQCAGRREGCWPLNCQEREHQGQRGGQRGRGPRGQRHARPGRLYPPSSIPSQPEPAGASSSASALAPPAWRV